MNLYRVTLVGQSHVFAALVPVLYPIIYWNSSAFLREGESMTYNQVKHFTLPFHEAKLKP